MNHRKNNERLELVIILQNHNLFMLFNPFQVESKSNNLERINLFVHIMASLDILRINVSSSIDIPLAIKRIVLLHLQRCIKFMITPLHMVQQYQQMITCL
ncbi:hypothetical protein CR513_58558, partial [Mucuna pruriens]